MEGPENHFQRYRPMAINDTLQAIFVQYNTEPFLYLDPATKITLDNYFQNKNDNCDDAIEKKCDNGK